MMEDFSESNGRLPEPIETQLPEGIAKVGVITTVMV